MLPQSGKEKVVVMCFTIIRKRYSTVLVVCVSTIKKRESTSNVCYHNQEKMKY